MSYVRDSFNEYKKTLEQVLQGLSYLYSGDIISSNVEIYEETKDIPLTSPTFILNSVKDIYDKSFSKLFNEVPEIVIPNESINRESNIIDFIISKLNFKPCYLFCSDNSKKLLGLTKKMESLQSLPGYFYSIDKYVGINLDVFYCPLIKEEDDDYVFYVVDSAIQSLVWIIQNMDYSISPIDETNTYWQHKIVYNFYTCKYNSVKIVIRNVSKIRESKINNLLSENKS